MTDLLDRLKTALADRYRIEQEIGSGGMAAVHLAEDLLMTRVAEAQGPCLAQLIPDPYLRPVPAQVTP